MSHPPTHKQPAEKKLITPQLVLGTIRHWWLLAVPSGLLLAAAAGAVVYVTFEPEFQAKVLLRIRQDAPGFPWSKTGQDRNFAKNQVALIRSSPVLRPVVARPDVFRLPEISQDGGKLDPVDAISRRVAISPLRGSDLYNLTCTSSTANGAALIANAVAEEYLHILGDQEAKRSQQLIGLLEEELTKAERKSNDDWQAVRKMTIDQTGRDPYAAQADVDSTALAPINAMQNRIMLLESERTFLQARLKAAERHSEQNPLEVSDAMIDDYVKNDPRLTQMQQSLWQLDGDLSEIKSKSSLREKDRIYQSKLAEKKRLESVFEAMRTELREPAKQQLTEVLASQRDDSLQDMRDRLTEYDMQLTVLLEQHRDELSKVKKFSGITLDLEVKRQELDRSKDLAIMISDRIFALKTQLRAPARVELVTPAKPPTGPIEATPTKKIVMAGGAAFVIPFVLAFFWELRLRRLSSSEQLQEFGRMPILGETSRFPVRAATADSSVNTRVGRALRTFEESVESVRHCITLSPSLTKVQVLGITSSTSQEGKTTLAAQLAVSIAKLTGEPTLLIDGDMRAPDMHEVFDTPLEPGLAELLTSPTMLDDAIAPTWMDNLHLIPGGRLGTSPHKLLGNERLAEVMQVLRQRYRHIILDTPPVLAASESLLMLSRHVDATVVCTMRDVSRVDQVQKTSGRLTEAGANVVGCVFNGVPQRRYEYTYGKYYYQ